MSLTAWLISYLVLTTFWIWIVRWGGAEWIEGRLLSGFLISMWAVNWSVDGIKVFGWGALSLNTALFILGIIWPDFRMLNLF